AVHGVLWRLSTQHAHGLLGRDVPYRSYRLLRVVGGVWRDDHVRQFEQRVLGTKRFLLRGLFLEIIEGRARNPTLRDGFVERLVVDDRTARGIDQQRGLLHASQSLSIEQMMGVAS